MVVAVFARVPVTAGGIILTLHVLWDLNRGYAAAGVVAAAVTVGTAVGAPLLGRLIDTIGARPVLALTTVAEALFWFLAPSAGYQSLLVLTAATSLFRLPVFSLVRQSLAALVPPSQRRGGYALDSMSVELSYLVGPALAVFAATRYTPKATMFMLGAAIVAAGLALFILNPVVRAEETLPKATAPARRLGSALCAQLVVAAATTTVLSGTDVALIAALRADGQTSWTGVVFGCWSCSSLIGGFVYGTVRRPPSPGALVGLLGIATIPIGFAGGWPWLGLAILPAGLFCAPALAGCADAVSRLAPPSASGEIMGWHGAAMTAGMSLGAPLTGAIIDATSVPAGFAVVGAVGALVSLGLLLISRGPAAHQVPEASLEPAGPVAGKPM
jgi:predicted MFS family arabinose efflux permease